MNQEEEKKLKRREYDRMYREKNKEKIKEYNQSPERKEQYKKHNAKRKDYFKQYFEENREKRKEYYSREDVVKRKIDYDKQYRGTPRTKKSLDIRKHGPTTDTAQTRSLAKCGAPTHRAWTHGTMRTSTHSFRP